MLDGRELARELSRQLHQVLSLPNFDSQSAHDELIEALLRAGELECGLTDCPGLEQCAQSVTPITGELATALIARRSPSLPANVLDRLSKLSVPEHLTGSSPEGFCYYALHPLDYVDLLNNVAINAPCAAVIGIRSIGTTLSAIVRSWFELKGIPAARITVRPTGNPFDRKLSLDRRQIAWITTCAQRGAEFFIVDEGPGLSGSSFLAVAEALMAAGVAKERIVLLPSSAPDLSRLIAPNAAERWSRFRTLSLQPTRHIPTDARHDIGWGEWRRRVFASEAEWPAVWSWTERRKYLSEDERRIFRFDGHGHYGKSVRHRSELLAAHGWGPEISSSGNGFSVSPWLNRDRQSRANRGTVIELAHYCAFRAEHFARAPVSQAPLEEMTRVNLDRALGVNCAVALSVERPVIADARMMPHEWICKADGRLLKLDAASHGDDHFYPGPTDIAWDVAGAIAEWNLDREACELLVSEYQKISGDKLQGRLPAYQIAYCAFRLAFTSSAAISVNADERPRFQSEAQTYRERLARLLPLSTAA